MYLLLPDGGPLTNSIFFHLFPVLLPPSQEEWKRHRHPLEMLCQFGEGFCCFEFSVPMGFQTSYMGQGNCSVLMNVSRGSLVIKHPRGGNPD